MKKSRLILFPVLVMSIGMMTGCEDQIKNISADFQSQIDGIKSDIDDLKKQITEAKSQIESLKSDMEGKIATVKGDYEKKIADAEAEIESLNTALNNAIKQHADDKKAIEDDYTAKLASLSDAHNADKQALQEDYNNKINALETAYKNKVQEIETSISNLNSSVTSLQNEMNQQILSIQNDYNSKINSLTERVSILEEVKTHTVNFNSEGGSEITSQTIVHGEKASRPANPIRKGFTFKGWTLYGEPWSFIGYSVTEDIYLHAEWERNQYRVYINNNNYSAGYVTGDGTYYYDDYVTLRAYANPGYSFNGWYNDNNELLSDSDQFDVVVENDITYYANFNDGNEYTLNFVADGWEVNNAPTSVKYGQYYTLPTPEPRNGYSFNGWSLEENGYPISMEGTWRWISDGICNLYAVSSYTVYSISYVLNGGENNKNNIKKFDITTEFTFLEPARTGYEFSGWYDAAGNKVEAIIPGTYGDLVLKAEWNAVKYGLNVSSNDEAKGTVETNGDGFMDEIIEVTATPKEDCYFLGWFDENDYFIDNSFTYSFKMTNKETSLKAEFLDKTEMNEWKIKHGVLPKFSDDGKQVTYGMYPQSVVTDADLIEKLNGITIKYGNYYYYEDAFYYKTTGNPGTSVITFDNSELIEPGKEYWFNVEPINWLVAKNEDGKAFLVADSVLDNVQYSNNTGVYYDISYIRNWLNNDFYNMSFGLDSSYVTVTHVDNSGESTLNPINSYACPDTEDNVFLLSAAEVGNEDLKFERQGIATEYSRVNGINCSMNPANLYHSIYWTRSPMDGYDNYAMMFVALEGIVKDYTYVVCSGHEGVRPAITLSLETNQEFGVEFENDNMTITVNKTKKANVTYSSNTFEDYSTSIRFYSDNEEVAVVNNQGEITGVSEGETSVIVFIDMNGNGVRDEGEAFDSCAIKVKAESEGIELDYSALTETGKLITETDALEIIGQNNSHVTSVTCSKIYNGNSSGGAFEQSSGFLKAGTGSGEGIITITLDVEITKVEILCHDWRKKTEGAPTNSNTITVNNCEPLLAPYNEEGTFETLTFELEEAVTVFTITTHNRAFIKQIKVS